MPGKNIKIQIYTDNYYARFIGIWRPEEEPDYVPLDPDPRPEQERNLPYFLVVTNMFKGRQEVVGENPVATTVHPMPPEFLKKNIRHFSYMFANEYGIFQPPTKAAANSFLAKMKVGFNLVKEVKVTVAPSQGNMSLKQYKDSLSGYTEEELQAIKVRVLGQHPEDAYALDEDREYIHTREGFDTEQYVTVTKLMNVYDMENPTIDTPGMITREDATEAYAPGTEDHPVTEALIDATMDNMANLEVEAAIAATASTMDTELTDEQIAEQEATAEAEGDTAVTDIVPELTRDQVQQRTIKDLQKRIKELEETQVQNPATI